MVCNLQAHRSGFNKHKGNPFFYQVFFFLDWVKYLLNDARLFKSFLRITLTCVITVGTLTLGISIVPGYIDPLT